MTDKQPTPEADTGKAEESDGASPMDKFHSLTRRLLQVTPEQVREEQRKLDAAKGIGGAKRA